LKLLLHMPEDVVSLWLTREIPGSHEIDHEEGHMNSSTCNWAQPQGDCQVKVCVSCVNIITYCVWKLRVRGPCEVTSLTFIVLLACHAHCMWHSSVHLDSIGLHCTVLCSLHNSHTHTHTHTF
jgi:hypothetical protein